MARFSFAPWFRKLLGKGVNKDIAPELLPDGYARSQFHVRPTSTTGATGSVEAVGGEQLLYDTSIPGQDTYVYIGGGPVNNGIVEFWASNEANLYDPLVRIDGVVAAQSPNIPYTFDRPLQVAIETRCRGGIIYPADHQSIPLYWDIQDMLDNVGNSTYFADYTTDYNSVGLSTPSEFPRFAGLVSGLIGLPTGKYVYSLRYVTPAGDRTNRGPETPMFSVPRVQDFVYDSIYPSGRTTGGETDLLVPTQYGIRLEFRIDNIQGYESVEVCRMRVNEGLGITSPGIFEVVARIPINPGQFSILSYTDPGEFAVIPPEVIPPDEAADQQETINAPKGVELSDNRLLYANYQTNPLITDLQFSTGTAGLAVVPITQRLTTVDQSGTEFNSGHNDPFNLSYYQSFMRGERYGLGIQLWDAQSAKLPVVDIPGFEDYQFPNKRDVKGSFGPYGVESQQYSTDTIDAANTQCQSVEPVTPTFDSVTQGNQKRTETGTTINVSTALPTYKPLYPISPADANTLTDGWKIPPQIGRFGSPAGGSPVPDNGFIFGQRHHALGGLIHGVSGIPSNIKAITVARTEPANRVVAQGFGFWDMRNGTPDEGNRAQRSSNSLRVHFPDIDAALVQQSILEDIIENPASYRVQLVGYYGFYQDVYGYSPRADITATDIIDDVRAADMLLYASVMNDPDGQVNVLARSRAYQKGPNSPSPEGEYVGPGKWRNPEFYGEGGDLPFNVQPEQGNYLYPIDSLLQVTEGRGSYWKLTTNEFIYTPSSQDTDGAIGLNSNEIRRFHQPVYTVNIVRVGAEVPDQTTQTYVNTGTTIRMASTIGVMPAGSPPSISFRLLNERMEDVRPLVLGDTPDGLRYIWVKEPGQPERAWVNMTNMTLFDPGDVIDAIAADGFWLSPDGTQVYGIYQVRSNPQFLSFGQEFSSGVEYSILLGSFSAPGGILPPEGTRFTVKFCGKNVRFFGGDVTISKQVFSPYDGQFASNALGIATIDDVLRNPPPMPMWGTVKPSNYVMPWGLLDGESLLNPIVFAKNFESVRQIAVMWDAETRLNSVMNLFSPKDGTDHIHTNYILRPFLNTSLQNGVANGFYPQYDADYQSLLGYNVASEFAFGGIQFRRTGPSGDSPYNYDYSKQPNITFVGIPEVGYEDRSDRCNAIAASNEVDPAQQDLPGLRTFLSSNVKFLSQENGEIKLISSALAGNAGRNIYAWTQQGVSRVLTNKNILTGATGEQVATQVISNFWGDEMILTKNIGLPDQMWRMFVKGFAPTGRGYADSFFWMDRKGAYRMTGDNIMDISRDRFLSALIPTLQSFPTDYSLKVGSLYNPKDDEVWFSVGEQVIAPNPPFIPSPVRIPPRLFVYNALRGEWIDQFAFQFDSYTANNQRLYGFRGLQTYDLDTGSIINGVTREARVMVPFFGDVGKFKQHLRWRITPSGALADSKPDEIRIYDENMNLISIQNEALAAAVNPAESQYWVLWYDGWEQWSACAPASIDPQERPPQSHGFFVELIWRSEGYKSLLAVSSQLQNIR